MSALLLAVDGGNAKTDLALVAADGACSRSCAARGSSPHQLGVDGALDGIEALVERGAAPTARRRRTSAASARRRRLPAEEETRCSARARARLGRARRRSRTTRSRCFAPAPSAGWGVAVVCGAGINCLGLAPDGRAGALPGARRRSRGDWGGGQDVGVAAVWAAARSEDGRGPQTTLEQLVPAHFGLATPLELAEAMHIGAISRRRVVELAPLVLRGGRATTRSRPGSSTGSPTRSSRSCASRSTRLGLIDEPVDVVLGGGLLQARDAATARRASRGARRARRPHALRVVEAAARRRRRALRARRARRDGRRARARLRRARRALAEVVDG